jgi:transposase InsO family protein
MVINTKLALPVAANLLNREFTPPAPNQLWTADITSLWTDDGWLYLAIVLDLFNREGVGWSLTADRVTDALTMAWFRRKPLPGLIHHADRGSQSASHAFQNKLTGDGRVCSMSRKGNGGDNAPTESGFNRFKNERVFGARFATREAMTTMACESIEVFDNRKRLHSTLGDTSPMRFFNDWRSKQQDQKQVA